MVEFAHLSALAVGNSDSLKRVFFASCTAFDRVYIHGGCVEAAGKLPEPLADVLLFDAETVSVGRIDSQTAAPKLCKHKMIAMGHMLLVVGGWDGYKRRHHCWLFDTRCGQWTLLTEKMGTDPEQAPAGLSSHAISPISSDHFLVTGREGSVRYQKRFGSIFTLKVSTQELYYEYSRSSKQIDSRSGHSSSIVPSFTRSARKSSPAVLIIGGRNADNIDSIPLKSFEKIELPEFDKAQMETMDTFRFKLNPVKTAFRLHAAETVSNWVLLHGGCVFNKMRNNTIGTDMYLYDSSCSRWYIAKIKGNSKLVLKRFGHSMSSINGKLYILGGAENDDDCISQIVELQFQS